MSKYRVSSEPNTGKYEAQKTPYLGTFHAVLHVNFITPVYAFEKETLIKMFNDSINFGIFPENAKIAKLTPIFQLGKTELLKNYRPIPSLSCFSKILEQVMYNRLYKYLGENNLLFQ